MIEPQRVRSTSMTKEISDNLIKNIESELKIHVGQPALLFVKEGREQVPYFVTLQDSGDKVKAIHKYYSSDGIERGTKTIMPNVFTLLNGEQRIIFLNKEI